MKNNNKKKKKPEELKNFEISNFELLSDAVTSHINNHLREELMPKKFQPEFSLARYRVPTLKVLTTIGG